MLAQQFDDRQRTLDRTHAAGFCLGLHRFDLPQPEWTLACSFFKVQQDARRPKGSGVLQTTGWPTLDPLGQLLVGIRQL
ncbi:hypothetical protein D3C76_1808430 [compost metagenome]